MFVVDHARGQFGENTGPGVSFFRGLVTEDGLQFKEFFEPGLTPFSAVPRLFVAAKATSKVDSRTIDVYVT